MLQVIAYKQTFYNKFYSNSHRQRSYFSCYTLQQHPNKDKLYF